MSYYQAEYDTYARYVDGICKAGDISSFKTHPAYTYMLEHVLPEQGQAYLDCIRKNTGFPEEAIQAFCTLNDSIGAPAKTNYGAFSCSPSSLRYIYQSHLILTYLQSLGSPLVDLVELGGGYGGLCMALHFFAPRYALYIQKYHIIDLEPAGRLQRMVLQKTIPFANVEIVDASTYGATIASTGLFLVSNYCFSEIASAHQVAYRKTLFPKIAHGFIAWNHIPVYDFGFPYTEKPEEPNTGGVLNRYIYF
jgi:hypothetical protein